MKDKKKVTSALVQCIMVFSPLNLSGESAVLSFVNWLTLSGAEQSGHRGPSTENQEAKQAAILCIKVRGGRGLHPAAGCVVYAGFVSYPLNKTDTKLPETLCRP